MTNDGQIIFLNGTSSAGKTSIARLLQEQLGEPYLHIALDAFLGMFPSSFVEVPRDFEGIPPEIAIYLGPAARPLISGYHHALAACTRVGNNLIVDHVLLDRLWLQECVALLADFSVFFVGVHCPLAILEARERVRGDRQPGLARIQFDRVHAASLCDLEVDTSLASPQECAERIVQALAQPPAISAFQQLRTLLSGD